MTKLPAPEAKAPPFAPASTTRSELDRKTLSAFESLVRRLARDRASSSPNPSTQSAALLEMELDGQTYSLLRRQKNPITACVELSPREREIVRMIADGYPNKAIAGVLEISEWTVGTHVRRVFAKLSVSSRAAMVAKWLEHQALEREGAQPPLPARAARERSEPAIAAMVAPAAYHAPQTTLATRVVARVRA